MKFLIAASLALSLFVAGCASTGSPPAASETTSGPALIPSGPLQPITPAASQPGSRSVTLLAPPADMWDRIRRGFNMPNLDSDLVRSQEQWYASRPDYIQRMTERSSK